MGDVALPALVGQGRLEADQRRVGTLRRLGLDEAAPREHPTGRRCRGHVISAMRHVPGDRARAGVEARIDKVLAQGDDLVFEVVRVRFGRLWGRRDREASAS